MIVNVKNKPFSRWTRLQINGERTVVVVRRLCIRRSATVAQCQRRRTDRGQEGAVGVRGRFTGVALGFHSSIFIFNLSMHSSMVSEVRTTVPVLQYCAYYLRRHDGRTQRSTRRPSTFLPAVRVRWLLVPVQYIHDALLLCCLSLMGSSREHRPSFSRRSRE